MKRITWMVDTSDHTITKVMGHYDSAKSNTPDTVEGYDMYNSISTAFEFPDLKFYFSENEAIEGLKESIEKEVKDLGMQQANLESIVVDATLIEDLSKK